VRKAQKRERGKLVDLSLRVLVSDVAQHVGLVAGSIVDDAKAVVGHPVTVLTKNQLDANISHFVMEKEIC